MVRTGLAKLIINGSIDYCGFIRKADGPLFFLDPDTICIEIGQFGPAK
jgi:hypothetical protein